MDYLFYKNEFDKIVLSHGNRIVITTHINPDGDALSSIISLHYYLTEILKLKNVLMFISGDKPKLFNNLYNFNLINFVDDIANVVEQEDLVIFLDSNNASQFTKSINTFKSSKFILVDHHTNNSDLEFIFKIDPFITNQSFVSVSEMIYLFFLKNYEIDKEICKLLFLGIYTDSGGFIYIDSEKSKCFLTAYDLVEKGDIKIESFVTSLFSKNLEALKVLAIYIQNLQIQEVANWLPFSVSYITIDDAKKFSKDALYAGTGMFKSYLNSLEGASWGFFIRPDLNEESSWSISLRSINEIGNINVREIATKFNGGGHIVAAGASVVGKDHTESLDKIFSFLQTNPPILID